MKINEEIRKGVIKSLPEAEDIKNEALREKVYDAWTLALEQTGYKHIEDIPATGVPGSPEMKTGTQADHQRATALLAVEMAKTVMKEFKGFKVDLDEVLAAGLCHDLGKPFEYDPKNRARWEADPRKTGLPAFRHPVYGVHVALTAGLPESIAHVVGAHSHNREGEFVQRSLVCELIHYADLVFWELLDKAGLLVETEQAGRQSS